MECNCGFCGIQFSKRPNQVKGNNRDFCSTECYAKARTTKVEIPCNFCGELFFAHLSDFSSGRGKYCSRECYHKARVGMLSGENHYNWQGGITPAIMQIRKSHEYKEWRDAVYARDNYTCQECGDHTYKGRGKHVKLHAHHIFTFADFPDLRFEVWNGITLCENCHMKLHHGVKEKVA